MANGSFDDEPPFDGRIQAAGAPVRETAVTQAEIDDVVNDARLSPTEREARLTDLRQRILDNEHADADDQYAPLQTRIMDALSMLAEGGHDYDGSLHVEGERAEDEVRPRFDDESDA